MRCALIKISTNVVENLIMADPVVDPKPEGYLLVGVQDDDPVSMGWVWNGQSFTNPQPE